jgi:hypothetical protein
LPSHKIDGNNSNKIVIKHKWPWQCCKI